APVAAFQSSVARDVGEGSVTVVMEERVGAEVGYKNIRIPVIVKICRRGGHSPTFVDQAALTRHIGKCPIPVVPKQAAGGSRQAGIIEQLEGGAVDQENVQQAVVVVIEQRHAVTHFFHQVILHQGATGVAKSIQACLFCHIGEPWPRGQDRLPQLVIGKDGNNETHTG